MKKLRLWFIAHGIEFERGWSAIGHDTRAFSIAINHRFYGVDLGLIIRPFKGVYTDELDTPHAEIAAQYKKDAERR